MSDIPHRFWCIFTKFNISTPTLALALALTLARALARAPAQALALALALALAWAFFCCCGFCCSSEVARSSTRRAWKKQLSYLSKTILIVYRLWVRGGGSKIVILHVFPGI